MYCMISCFAGACVSFQLRYYDSAEDSSYKGFIDMKEVTSVVELSNVQGLPKKADDHAVFEVSRYLLVSHMTVHVLWVSNVLSPAER